METKIFDGKGLTLKLEEKVKSKIGKLATKPKLVSLLVGENPGSKLYLSLKQKAAGRVGVLMDVVNFREDSNPVSMNRFIDTFK